MVSRSSASAGIAATIMHNNLLPYPFLDFGIFCTAQGERSAVGTISARSGIAAIRAIAARAVHRSGASTTAVATIATFAAVSTGQVDDEFTFYGNTLKVQKKIDARRSVETLTTVSSYGSR